MLRRLLRRPCRQLRRWANGATGLEGSTGLGPSLHPCHPRPARTFNRRLAADAEQRIADELWRDAELLA
jgi:hypothetical protein